MEHVENGAGTRVPCVKRSGKERRRQTLPVPQGNDLRCNPDRRQALSAPTPAPELIRKSVQASLLRYLSRY